MAFECLLILIAGILFMVILMAVVCGDGDKGLLEILG